MDLRTILKTRHHDLAWLDRYLTFIADARVPGSLVDRHHILPQAAFPAYASFDEHPWNRALLTPADHLVAHYYLFRALPGDPSVRQAFKMMVGFRFKALQRSFYDEALVLEIAAAFEAARGLGKPWSEEAKQRRSDVMRGQPVPGLSFKGRKHRTATLEKMSESQQRRALEDPESFTRNKPCGEAHWARRFGFAPEARSKISASLTGKEASDLTRARMSVANSARMLSAITPEENLVFHAAMEAKTEEEMLTLRKAFKVNSRPYNILTGLITIRLEKRDEVEQRYWQQAWTWLQEAKVLWWAVKSRTSRLGTGHALLPDQIPAHLLRNVGLAKGVTQARKAHDAIPQDEKDLLLKAWRMVGDKPGSYAAPLLTAARRGVPVRGRAYNILFGMQWILEGKATPETFPRWRQAALFLALSGVRFPFSPECCELVDHIVPV